METMNRTSLSPVPFVLASFFVACGPEAESKTEPAAASPSPVREEDTPSAREPGAFPEIEPVPEEESVRLTGSAEVLGQAPAFNERGIPSGASLRADMERLQSHLRQLEENKDELERTGSREELARLIGQQLRAELLLERALYHSRRALHFLYSGPDTFDGELAAHHIKRRMGLARRFGEQPSEHR